MQGQLLNIYEVLCRIDSKLESLISSNNQQTTINLQVDNIKEVDIKELSKEISKLSKRNVGN